MGDTFPTTPPGALGACTETDGQDDAALQEFEAEFHDGPPVAAVMLLLGAFMLGMALGGYLAWIG